MNTTHGRRGGTPYVQETVKVSEIKDRFGNTRFKVALTDFDDNGLPQDDDLRSFDRNFQVTVVSYCYSEEALTVVCEEFDVYEKAADFFRRMTERYSYLVEAETKDVQDIRIYAKRTGYHRICPDCCATCRWSRPCDRNNCLFDDWEKNLRGRFLCMNSKLYEPPKRDLVPDRGQHDGYHDFQKERFHVIDIHPVVDRDGICGGFERRADEKYRDPSHSEWRFRNHDMAPENRLETIAKFEVEQKFRDAEEKIARDIGSEIERQLDQHPPIIEGNRNLGGETVYDGGGAE